MLLCCVTETSAGCTEWLI